MDEIKEEGAFHQLWSEVWVIAKVFCYNGLERGEEHGKFVDESGKDVYRFAQIQVVPLAEKCSSKVISFMKACTD